MCLENHVHIPWYSNKIFYDRWYNEFDEEKQVAETAAHIIRQDIHMMIYDSYTPRTNEHYTYSTRIVAICRHLGNNMGQQNINGFLLYVLMMQISTLSSISLAANIHFTAWQVFNAPHLPVTQTL